MTYHLAPTDAGYAEGSRTQERADGVGAAKGEGDGASGLWPEGRVWLSAERRQVSRSSRRARRSNRQALETEQERSSGADTPEHADEREREEHGS
jgi:hypothetical protein